MATSFSASSKFNYCCQLLSTAVRWNDTRSQRLANLWLIRQQLDNNFMWTILLTEIKQLHQNKIVQIFYYKLKCSQIINQLNYKLVKLLLNNSKKQVNNISCNDTFAYEYRFNCNVNPVENYFECVANEQKFLFYT